MMLLVYPIYLQLYSKQLFSSAWAKLFLLGFLFLSYILFFSPVDYSDFIPYKNYYEIYNINLFSRLSPSFNLLILLSRALSFDYDLFRALCFCLISIVAAISFSALSKSCSLTYLNTFFLSVLLLPSFPFLLMAQNVLRQGLATFGILLYLQCFMTPPNLNISTNTSLKLFSFFLMGCHPVSLVFIVIYQISRLHLKRKLRVNLAKSAMYVCIFGFLVFASSEIFPGFGLLFLDRFHTVLLSPLLRYAGYILLFIFYCLSIILLVCSSISNRLERFFGLSLLLFLPIASLSFDVYSRILLSVLLIIPFFMGRGSVGALKKISPLLPIALCVMVTLSRGYFLN